MPIGSSGAISIGNGGSGSNTINSEFGRSATTQASFEELFTGAYGTINITNLNANKPSGETPYRMSDFYRYEHSVTLAASNGSQSFGSSGGNGSSTITHAEYSTFYVSSKPSWISITSGNYGSSNKDTGDGSVTFSVSSNSSSSRSGTIQITFDVGTSGGGAGDSDSTTTRNISVSQSGGSGGGGGGGGRGNGLPDP
tara:strand:- start:1912 stop:2502 length:591 start_codon:yes stop_codon:yes gene_type:complete